MEHDLGDREYMILRTRVNNAVGGALPDLLHTLMFVPNLSALCTKEQLDAWLPEARAWRMLGCYAQTELGHGSNVRALQTTATYDAATDEFVIHTPCKEATKWWPGSLGCTANYAMVYARLLIDGKDYGVHNFLVPLRDQDTHELLPGVRTGDIGPKIGYQVRLGSGTGEDGPVGRCLWPHSSTIRSRAEHGQWVGGV